MATRSKKLAPSDAAAAPQPIKPEAREQDIAVSAYYRAEARGFAAGRELEDWLQAEQEVAAYDAAK